MGVFKGRGATVDVNAISAEMRDAVRPWETAYILILDPGRDMVNFKTKDPAALVWDGRARVQPYRREIAVGVPADPTTTQTVRFQIDFTKDGAIPLIRSGYYVIVIDPALVPDAGIEAYPDPYITNYVHIVNASMNSSMAWIRTLETITNTERRNDFQIESDGAGGLQWA
jgi:hypothetical protein